MIQTSKTKKIFIVGSPRSGTTLLQGMLAAHPNVFSLPETFFFAKVQPRSFIKRKFLWPAIKVRQRLLAILSELGREDLRNIGNIGFFQSDYHMPFVRVMDRLSLDAGNSIWVEKTPWHLYCIDEIQRCIPEATIIHVVREGTDVVASLVKATQTYPEKWGALGVGIRSNGFSIDKAIARWNKDIKITHKYIDKKRNIVIRYEDILADPKSISNLLCQRLGINFDHSMLEPENAYSKIVNIGNEPWKANNAKKIINTHNTFQDFFSAEEEKYVKQKLLPYVIPRIAKESVQN